MKRSFIFLFLFLVLCSMPNINCDAGEDIPCGFHNGEQLYLGPKGGCYYINSNGNKEYVDRSECNC